MNKTTNNYSPEVRERGVRIVWTIKGSMRAAGPLPGRVSRSDVPKGGDLVDLGKDWLCAANVERMGEEG